MQTIGYLERSDSALALSLVERLSWVDKLPIALFSGLILALSTAQFGVWWLAWFALAPLLLLVLGSRSQSEAALIGLTYGLGYHMLSMRWLFDLHPMTWFVSNQFLSGVVAFQIWFLEALHQSLLYCVFAWFIYMLPMRSGFTPHFKRPFFAFNLAVPLFWVFLQWYIAPSPLFLGVPFDQLAYGQSRYPAIMQIAQFGGGQLIEFLIVMFNCVLASVLIETTGICARLPSRSDSLSGRVGAYSDLVFVIALVVLVIQWGQQEVIRDAAMVPYWESNIAVPSGLPGPSGGIANQSRTAAAVVAANNAQKASYAPAVPIAVVQGNINPSDSNKTSGTAIANRYVSLVKELGVALMVLPAEVVNSQNHGTEWLQTELSKVARDERKDVIVGVRQTTENSTIAGVKILSPIAAKDQLYVKYRLMPFSEYTPLGPFGSLLSGGMAQKLTGDKPFASADILSTVQSMWGRIGVSIESELVYPDLISHQVNKGASLLVNVSDLSLFHKSPLAQQLIAVACLRAVENGRYCIMSSNTGISAVIDPRGLVTSLSIQGQQGVLFDRVQFLHKRTPFTRMSLGTPLYR